MANDEQIAFDFCTPPTTFGIATLCIGIIASIITLIATIRTINEFKKDDQIWLYKKIIYGSTLTLFSISGFGYAMLHITRMTSTLCTLGYVEDISGSFAVLGYTLGLVSLYLSLTLRLNSLFDRSSFRLSSLLLYCLLSGAVIQIIPIPVFLYFLIIWHPLAFPLFSFWIILYIIFSLILLFVFCFKVYRFTKCTQQDLLKPVVIKYSILTTFAILTSLIVSILYLFIGLDVFKDASPIMDELVTSCSIPIDHAMNAICLMLHFSFSQKIYNSLCKKCDQCCFKMVENQKTLKMIKSDSDIIISPENGDSLQMTQIVSV